MPCSKNDNFRSTSLSRRQPAAIASIALAVALAMSACGKKGDTPAGANAAPRAPEVGVVSVHPGDIGLVTELPGRLEASRVAQVSCCPDTHRS